jgi:hypothetical protein
MSEEKDEKEGYILPDRFRFPPLYDPNTVAVIYENKGSLITEMLGKKSEETGTPMIKLIWGDLIKLKRVNPIWWVDGTPGCPACGHECQFVIDDATTAMGYYTCVNIECVNNAVQCQDQGQEG